MHIGFIGLGNMGSAMASNLVEAGHTVIAYNRSPAKVEALTGARPARSVPEACDGADVVVTMLANDEAVESVSFGDDGIIARLGESSVHVSSSTISVALASRLTDAHAGRFVSAPVFGRPEAARRAELFVVAAGPVDALTTSTPVFDAVGQRTFVLGAEPTMANLVKLSGNFLIASTIESLGEALALVGKAGVDRQQYLELLTSTLFDAPAYRVYGGLLARREFEPAGFTARLGLKDAKLTLAAADQLEVAMPVASLVRDRFLTLLATGGAELDWAAMGAVAEWEAGGPNPAARDST